MVVKTQVVYLNLALSCDKKNQKIGTDRLDKLSYPERVGRFFHLEVKLLITQESFLKALNNKAVRPQDMELLTVWHQEEGCSMTAERVMEVTGAKRASLIVNNLGKRIASFLEVDAGTGASVVAIEGDNKWVMKEELASALTANGTAEESNSAETTVKAAPVVKPSSEKAEPVEKQVAEEEGSLEAVLMSFDKDTIRLAYPNTPADQRLLNPAMIKALLEKRPANTRVYQRVISAELRKSVSVQESKMFLAKVLVLLKKA